MALSPQERSRRMRLNMLMAMSYAVAGRSTFTPLSLFSAGEVGAWYDPSDFSTMFQDSAGTTPVTAVEQPVGLILDKSRGATRTEMLTNGTFASDVSGWTAQNATASVSSGQVTLTNTGANGGIYQAITTVVGRQYFVTIQLVGVTGGGNVMFFIKSDSTNWASPNRINMVNGSSTIQTFTAAFTATATTSYIHIINGNVTVGHSITVDNASVIDIAGNHASQTTSTSRPVLSARVNLLTYTEQFDNAAWTNFQTSETSNAGVAPNGTTTADKLILDNAQTIGSIFQIVTGLSASIGYTGSVYMKAAEFTSLQLVLVARNGGVEVGRNIITVNLIAGTGVVSSTGTAWTSVVSSVTDAGNGWWHVSLSGITPATTTRVDFAPSFSGVTGNGTSGVLIWGADLRPSNQSTLPYQRVGAATAGSSSAAGTGDYDTTNFPLYLRWDGTDDGMVTAAINFSGTDNMSLVVGVRKLSDAATGAIVELTSDASTNNGAFAAHARNTSVSVDYRWFIRDSAGTTTSIGPTSGYAAPITNVLTATTNIAADTQSMRLNGVVAASSSSDIATGNFANSALYIGRRGGASLPFNGHLYGLVIVGRALTSTEITNTETWLNTKTKAF